MLRHFPEKAEGFMYEFWAQLGPAQTLDAKSQDLFLILQVGQLSV